MGADIKALRTRIKSVDSTLHLTKAMGLVASSKIRRATESMLRGREYLANLERVMDSLTSCPECRKSPYMRSPGENARTRMIIIAGDRGLAGGYNANVFRLAAQYPGVEFIPIGKRACDRFGKPQISSETYTREAAYSLAGTLCDDFAKGKFDRLGILSTRYVSVLTQEAFVRWVLPLAPKPGAESVAAIFEPDELTILNAAAQEYVAGVIAASVRESFASEVAARRAAMDSAEKNANEMIDNLQLQYNRARQSTITQEITEIVAGSGA